LQTPSNALLRLEQVSLKTVASHGVNGPPPLLQDISCAIVPGEFVALIGPSGAGKTSLLRLINRLSELSSGSIYLSGQEIRQIPVLQLRQQAVLVAQESRLLGMTVQDALTYPLTLRGLSPQEIRQRIATWTEQLHVPQEWMTHTELQLSVGQRQLVAIARALITQPKLLLLDEPTSALDAGRASHVMGVLRDLITQQQTTILMVNHQLELAKEFCSRVLYLQQGHLLHDFPAAQADWDHLRKTLIEAEKQQAADWE
jgi:D-methionine transport system ATP-binding protein